MLHPPRERRRRGVVLLAVLIVIVVLALAAYKYNEWMLAEARATESSGRAAQARAFAASGVHYAAALLASGLDQTLAGNPWDNPDYFQDIAVPSGEKGRPGKFSVLSLRPADEAGAAGQAYRYGVTDEGGKIPLNGLLAMDGGKGDIGKQLLMALPNMTEDIAAAILDWLDPDDTPRENGAENDVYMALSPPYRCKNGPLDSLEELLLVRGMTAQLLFGNDKNRNGILDPGEDDGAGQVDLGWQAYLTVYSREANVDSTGAPRIFVNEKDLNALKEKLTTAVGEDLANFIVAYRLYGTGSTGGSGGGRGTGAGGTGGGSSPGGAGGAGGAGGGVAAPGGGGASGGGGAAVGGGAAGGGVAGGGGGAMPAGGGGGRTTGGGGTNTSSTPTVDPAAVIQKMQQDLPQSGTKQLQKIASLWDLVDGQVSTTVQSGQTQRTVTYPSPLRDAAQMRELLPKLLDFVTASADMDLPPRLNVTTAAQAVLMGLKEPGGLTDEEVSAIVGARPAPGNATTDAVWKTPAWLVTEANLTVAKMKKLDALVTARSQVYRLQSLGYFDQGGPTARVEAVVDTNQGRPRIVYFRDISELGKGFDLGTGGQ